MEIGEYEAVVPLQSLLHKTIQRTLDIPVVRAKLDVVKSKVKGKVTLSASYKWGCDGTDIGKVYQEGAGSDGDNFVDTVLVSQMALLEIRCLETGDVILLNEFANSAHSSRPIRIAFEKEDIDSVQREYARVTDQVNNVSPLEPEDGVTVTFEDFPTLFDGKYLGFI